MIGLISCCFINYLFIKILWYCGYQSFFTFICLLLLFRVFKLYSILLFDISDLTSMLAGQFTKIYRTAIGGELSYRLIPSELRHGHSVLVMA